jgi:hypothetical protein
MLAALLLHNLLLAVSSIGNAPKAFFRIRSVVVLVFGLCLEGNPLASKQCQPMYRALQEFLFHVCSPRRYSGFYP